MVVKGTLLYLIIRYCGKCGERKKVSPDTVYCPEPNCKQRLRVKPKSRKYKEKYKEFKGY